MTAATERRLATLERQAKPPGDLFGTIHFNDPCTFPPGRIGVDIMRKTPLRAESLAGAYADTESEALRFIRGKIRGYTSPITVYCLQGGGWPPEGGAWQYPKYTKILRLFPGGEIETTPFEISREQLLKELGKVNT